VCSFFSSFLIVRDEKFLHLPSHTSIAEREWTVHEWASASSRAWSCVIPVMSWVLTPHTLSNFLNRLYPHHSGLWRRSDIILEIDERQNSSYYIANTFNTACFLIAIARGTRGARRGEILEDSPSHSCSTSWFIACTFIISSLRLKFDIANNRRMLILVYLVEKKPPNWLIV
jgi:hypothetical protein